jgi:hypothetical protein
VDGYADVSGTYTVNATPNTSTIVVKGDPNSAYQYSYTFTGPLNGPGYTQTSQMPPPPCILGPPCPTVGTATLVVDTFNGNNTAGLSFTDSAELFTGSGTLSCVTISAPPPPPPPPPQCGPFNVTITGNGTTTLGASYTPSFASDLQAAATICHYLGFDWQQQVTNLPCPSPNTLKPNVPGLLPSANYCGAPTLGSLTAGASSGAPPFLDPPPSGYYGSSYDPNPFYFSVQDATTIDNPANLNPVGIVVNDGGTTLQFSDQPKDPCLPSVLTLGRPFSWRAQYCGGSLSTDPPGSFVGFETSLVGIVDAKTPSPGLFTWTWMTTYDGQIPGGQILPPALSSGGAADPGAGYGTVTITSINGVPVPPVVPASQIATTASGLAYSRVSKTFDGTVTITNTSGTTITTPTNFQVVLTALPSGVTLENSAGTFNQSPYITVPSVTSLMPGQSVSVQVQFQNSSGATINFTPEFYAGSFQ